MRYFTARPGRARHRTRPRSGHRGLSGMKRKSTFRRIPSSRRLVQAAWRGLTILLVATAIGCGSRERPQYQTGNPEHDRLVNGAIDEMMKPSSAADRDWPAEAAPDESLAKLADHVKNIFANYEEVDELLFPVGWCRRRLEPVEVRHELIASGDGPTKGIIHLTYQKKSSVIRPTREAAAADNDLLPAPSAQTREQMTDPRRKPWPPVTLTIEYELQDDGQSRHWHRTGWSAEPENLEGDDFLDRLAVP